MTPLTADVNAVPMAEIDVLAADLYSRRRMKRLQPIQPPDWRVAGEPDLDPMEAADDIDGQIAAHKALGWTALELRLLNGKQFSGPAVSDDEFKQAVDKIADESAPRLLTGIKSTRTSRRTRRRRWKPPPAPQRRPDSRRST